MLETRRAVYLQLSGFAILIIALLLLAHFFPVISVVTDLQRRVTGMGKWGAIFYPLLFAACNVFLLPGGVLSVGAGFFFCGGVFLSCFWATVSGPPSLILLATGSADVI